MIRFCWLQARVQVIGALAALIVIAVILALTGPNLVHLYDTTVATCTANHDCSTATVSFLNSDGALQIGGDFLVLFVPALIGMFWGAPLVAREFEAGTFRLAWTQGVTRRRWTASKLGAGLLVSVLVTGLLSFMVTWWSSLPDQVRGERFEVLTFGVRDVVPIGYAAFAFSLGFACGLVLRRTLPAMASALVGFAGVRLAVDSWVRPNLIAPLHMTMPLNINTPLGIGLSQAGVHVTATSRGVLPATGSMRSGSSMRLDAPRRPHSSIGRARSARRLSNRTSRSASPTSPRGSTSS